MYRNGRKSAQMMGGEKSSRDRNSKCPLRAVGAVYVGRWGNDLLIAPLLEGCGHLLTHESGNLTSVSLWLRGTKIRCYECGKIAPKIPDLFRCRCKFSNYIESGVLSAEDLVEKSRIVFGLNFFVAEAAQPEGKVMRVGRIQSWRATMSRPLNKK